MKSTMRTDLKVNLIRTPSSVSGLIVDQDDHVSQEEIEPYPSYNWASASTHLTPKLRGFCPKILPLPIPVRKIARCSQCPDTTGPRDPLSVGRTPPLYYPTHPYEPSQTKSAKPAHHTPLSSPKVPKPQVAIP